MTDFRDWHDHPSEAGQEKVRQIDRKPKRRLAADGETLELTIDGPPPCCKKRIIASDMLVFYGGLPPGQLQKIRDRFPHLAGVADVDLYLCDGCRSTLLREKVLKWADVPNWKKDPNSRRYKEKEKRGRPSP